MKRLKLLLLFLSLFLLLFLFRSPILESAAKFLIVEDKLASAEVIVVLAGDDNGERVDQGVKLYKAGYAKKLLMSGGPLAWKVTAAQLMSKHAVALGVPSRNIFLEDKSYSTKENALFSKKIIDNYGFKKIILVTSPFHTRRSRRVFKKVLGSGVDLMVFPVKQSAFQVSRWWTRHEDIQPVLREYASLVFYFLMGY